ncbi:MAG TPA: hypothetical protein VJV74_11495 [Terriglobia bacterium]|nr:hypothetical protein [Terriglobia bacterium]
MTKPLCVDLFCGLGGWSEGFLAEGYGVIGFDIERHRYPARAIDSTEIKAGGIDFNRHDSFNGTTEKRLRSAPLTGGWDEYPGQLVLQDVLTIHGSQFRDAACIVASPPCQEFSYMAMPWKRAKQIAAALRGQGEFPEGYRGSRTIADLTRLFDACFRIQREASEAAGRHIPMVVENVKGAQPWVGRAPWNYGSFYLWGDVPALMPFTGRAQKFNPDGTAHGQGSWFAVADSKNRGAKGMGGSWFNQEHGRVVPGNNAGCPSRGGNEFLMSAGLKGEGGAWFKKRKDRGGNIERLSCTSSRSAARKAASAQIAKIPTDLARWIAQCFKPEASERVA